MEPITEDDLEALEEEFEQEDAEELDCLVEERLEEELPEVRKRVREEIEAERGSHEVRWANFLVRKRAQEALDDEPDAETLDEIMQDIKLETEPPELSDAELLAEFARVEAQEAEVLAAVARSEDSK